MLDEQGERIRDEAGNYVFNAVPTTDWGKPETLEFWREQWAQLCNTRFAEKGLDCRIDHRSYERQGVEQIPTQHEGPTVRAMEAKCMAERKLKRQVVDGKLPAATWREEEARLETEYRDLQTELTPLYADTKKLWAIHYSIYEVQHEQERQNSAVRQKKQEIEH